MDLKQKKVPIRKCVACREHGEKMDFFRIVRISKKSEKSLFKIDFSGKSSGRGAYVCKNEKCVELAQKKKALERAFRGQVPADIYLALKEALESAK